MKEVICIHKGAWMCNGFKIAGPEFEKPYFVEKVLQTEDGLYYYKILGFVGALYTAEEFVDVTDLSSQIDEALKAPEPRKHVYEPHLL